MTRTAGTGPVRAAADGSFRSEALAHGNYSLDDVSADDRPIASWEEAGFDDSLYRAAPPERSGWLTLLHGLGAIASLAVLVGLGVWGYGQVKRDVSGVPVVQALEGPARMAPVAPGGDVSAHAGLSVNAVKAGTPGEPAPERIRLASDGPGLAEEDRPLPDLLQQAAARAASDAASSDAETARPVGESGAPEATATPEDAADVPLLEAGLSATDVPTAAPALAVASGGEAPPQTEVSAPADASARDAQSADSGPSAVDVEAAVLLALASGPGLPRTLRPAPRPERSASLRTASLTEDAAPAPLTEQSGGADDRAEIAPGTRLVQLGAFESVEEARAAWHQIDSRFGPLLGDKSRVLQEAEAGGRAFWRLRAAGFADLSDARRFCAVLVAESAECIPVIAR